MAQLILAALFLLLFAAALLIVYAIWVTRTGGKPRNKHERSSGRRYAHIEGEGDYELQVVGESHYQDALDAITGGKTEEGHEFGCIAVLEREPDNLNDENAIAVYIKGQKVGYLPRPAARVFSGIFARENVDGCRVDAMIVGGWLRDYDEGHYGVRLDIPI